MDNEIIVEHFERFKIEHDNFATYYYPEEKTLTVDYFDGEEDLELEVWNEEDGWDESLEDVKVFKEDLAMFLEEIINKDKNF